MWTARRGAHAGLLLGLLAGGRTPASARAEEASCNSTLCASCEREHRLLHTAVSFQHIARLDLDRQRAAETSLNAGSKLLLVHLWSVHCAPCVQEMSELQSFYVQLSKGPSLRVAFVNEDRPDDVFARLRAQKLKLPELEHYVISQKSGLRERLGESSQPLTLLIDRKMTVRQAFIGPLNTRRNEILTAIERLRQAR